MKAIRIYESGGADQLRYEELPDPIAGAGQLLIHIYAASFNPVDAKIALGKMGGAFEVPFPWTPGADFAGVVEAVGPGVSNYRIGDEVYGSTPMGGSYAEKAAVDVSRISMKSKVLDPVEAASMPVVAQTAYQALDHAKLTAGQTILIHGASGGVGGMAVQLAKIRGAYVIATSSESSIERVRSYGADEVIDYKATPFESVVKDVDAVFDTVGGETQAKSFAVLKPGGILVAINQPPSQEEAAKYQVQALIFSMEASSANLKLLAGYVDDGKLKPFVGKTYPLSEAAQAWRDTEIMHTPGKVVFTVS